MRQPGQFAFSNRALEVLREGRILRPGEHPSSLLERVSAAAFEAEGWFGTPRRVVLRAVEEFQAALEAGEMILGTPALTNAGRTGPTAPLSSCAAIPVNLHDSFASIRSTIEAYYGQNMGSGFDLGNVSDPVTMLQVLNSHAQTEYASGRYERYIGNMANLSLTHPRIFEFIRLKARKALPHFNLSVSVPEAFFPTLFENGRVLLDDGTIVLAERLWTEMVDAAYECGDPGLLFMERFNRDNPTPLVAAYTTTAPCAEVGLAPGETCVFGYLNVARFVGARGFDFGRFSKSARTLVRVLDNLVESSLRSYASAASANLMRLKRRIGVGICGYADLLALLRLRYGSADAKALLANILITMTFETKVASVSLAQERGSFPAISGSRHMDQPSLVMTKYGSLETLRVSAADWRELDSFIRRHVALRNASTTALPPSGRSALLLGASNSIEPWFEVPRAFQMEGHPTFVVTATELSVAEHLLTVATASRCVDEATSKTVNLASDALRSDVETAFFLAWELGLKAVSVYREGSVFRSAVDETTEANV